MSSVLTKRDPVRADRTERAQLAEISAVLNHPTVHRITLDGEGFALPLSLLDLLRQMTTLLAAGEAVILVPLHKEVTTREAADFLNISRQYFVQILNEEAMPYHMVGTHRRIYVKDLMEYRQRRDADRHYHRDRLIRLSEKAGLYAQE